MLLFLVLEIFLDIKDKTKQRGFFTIAQNGEAGNYLRMAYALALSLHVTQSETPWLSVGVTPGQEVPDKYRAVFDKVIEIPWGDLAEEEVWKLNNEWKVIYMTPYEETIKLDADFLFFQDIQNWWEMFADRPGNSNISICKHVMTYRQELADDKFYRTVFRQNNLPNAYSALSYFRQSEETTEFFKHLEYMFKHWKEYEWAHIDHAPQYIPTTDVLYALVAKIMDKENEYFTADVPTFIHMKSNGQNLGRKFLDEEWMNFLPYYFTPKLELFIGNFKQTLPFHYHIKKFLTDEIIKSYEKILDV